MARRRKRRKLNPGPILALLLVGNIAAGLYASPLTTVTRVKVTGAKSFDRARIERELSAVQDVPALRERPRLLETRLMQLPEMQDAEFKRNIFGRADLTVTYREPVARVVGGPPAALSKDGVLYRTNTLPAGLVQVIPPESGVSLTLAGGWQTGNVAELCTLIENSKLKDVVVRFEKQGGLCLNIGSKLQARLGLATELEKKLGVLRRELEVDPSHLDRAETFVLLVPDRPTIKVQNPEVTR